MLVLTDVAFAWTEILDTNLYPLVFLWLRMSFLVVLVTVVPWLVSAPNILSCSLIYSPKDEYLLSLNSPIISLIRRTGIQCY
jgi:hypothetical protein